MFWLPSRDETMALRLEDLASTLDAGLDVRAVTERTATAFEGGLVDALVGDGLALDPAERSVLEAAEVSGTLPTALRGRAEERRQRARLARDLWSRLRYPMVLVLMSCFVSALAGAALGHGLTALYLALSLPAVLAIAIVWLKTMIPRPGFQGGWLPGLRPLLRDAGEIPYLESLAGLYGAGIPILEAHREALRTVPVGFVRARLFEAEQSLATGAVQLTEGLARSRALGDETLRILTAAEQAGQLEDALHRALARRRQTFAARAGAAIRWTGILIYVAVVGVVATLVISFYGNLYGALGR